MMPEYFKTTDSVKIEKLDRNTAGDERYTRARAIRLYTTQHGAQGQDNTWGFTIQFRGPLMLGFAGQKEGKDFIIANARFNAAELRELRDAINAKLAES